MISNIHTIREKLEAEFPDIPFEVLKKILEYNMTALHYAFYYPDKPVIVMSWGSVGILRNYGSIVAKNILKKLIRVDFSERQKEVVKRKIQAVNHLQHKIRLIRVLGSNSKNVKRKMNAIVTRYMKLIYGTTKKNNCKQH
jgi:hypothetical protein